MLLNDRIWHFVRQPLEGYIVGIYTELGRMSIYFPVKVRFCGHFELVIYAFEQNRNEKI